MRTPYRTTLLQTLIDKYEYKSYLEIGIDNSRNFNSIKCTNKVSVDPAKDRYRHAKPTHKMTSDEYFKTHNDMFDIVFIDGLHENTQVYKDIQNALNILNTNGTIVCHDLNPAKEKHQIVPRVINSSDNTWNGDCWKAWVRLRCEQPDLHMVVINEDHGLGVIKRGEQVTLDVNDVILEYKHFSKNRKKWLNIISRKQFEQTLRY